MLYRIWVDDGKHTEEEDGEDFEGASARDAVEEWAASRYAALQHVDPGMVLVRTPQGTVEAWDVSVVMSFRIHKRAELDKESADELHNVPPAV